MNNSLKKVYFFIPTLFIFFIHLPFVFAKTIPPVSFSKINLPNGDLPNPLTVSVYDSLHLMISVLQKMHMIML